MENRIIEIIEEISEYNDLKSNKDMDLLENEIIDSLGFIELVSCLEEEFDIEIQPTQIPPDTWRYVESIKRMVEELIEK